MPTEHVLKWAQDAPGEVDGWEFQYSPNTVVWRWVQTVQPSDVCADCFEAVVTLPDQIAAVRMRSVKADGTASTWSNVQYSPESSGAVGLAVGLLALIITGAGRRRRR